MLSQKLISRSFLISFTVEEIGRVENRCTCVSWLVRRNTDIDSGTIRNNGQEANPKD